MKQSYAKLEEVSYDVDDYVLQQVVDFLNTYYLDVSCKMQKIISIILGLREEYFENLSLKVTDAQYL